LGNILSRRTILGSAVLALPMRCLAKQRRSVVQLVVSDSDLLTSLEPTPNLSPWLRENKLASFTLVGNPDLESVITGLPNAHFTTAWAAKLSGASPLNEIAFTNSRNLLDPQKDADWTLLIPGGASSTALATAVEGALDNDSFPIPSNASNLDLQFLSAARCLASAELSGAIYTLYYAPSGGKLKASRLELSEALGNFLNQTLKSGRAQDILTVVMSLPNLSKPMRGILAGQTVSSTDLTSISFPTFTAQIESWFQDAAPNASYLR